VAGVAWTWSVMPTLVKSYNATRIAPRVMSGHSFDAKLLEGVLPPASDTCQASLTNAAAIVHLRLYELAVARVERELISERTRSLREAMRRSLSCSPTMPFHWFLLYWLEAAENGLNEKAFQYLRMSYVLGPNEGWISAKRNGFSLAIYDQLPADVAARVVAEFVSLVASGFYSQAAANLSGPGWSNREILVASLTPIPEGRKYEFSKYLRAEGRYLDIPGLAPIERRPWN
jgi:hypothetical protein